MSKPMPSQLQPHRVRGCEGGRKFVEFGPNVARSQRRSQKNMGRLARCWPKWPELVPDWLDIEARAVLHPTAAYSAAGHLKCNDDFSETHSGTNISGVAKTQPTKDPAEPIHVLIWLSSGTHEAKACACFWNHAVAHHALGNACQCSRDGRQRMACSTSSIRRRGNKNSTLPAQGI